MRVGGNGPAVVLLHGFGDIIVMRNAANKVTEVVIPGAGHWLMEEAPKQTIAAIRDFMSP